MTGGNLRILDMFKSFKPKQKKLELGQDISTWPNDLISNSGIDIEYKRFQETVETHKKEVMESIKPYTDENTLAAIPDRARTMSALHGQEFFVQTKKLLSQASFTDIFSFEKEQDAFLEANNNYKSLVAKNTSALGEFFHDELKSTHDALQELEDTIIKFTSTLETLQFPKVRKAKELEQKINQLSTRSNKYSQLLSSLKQDLARTQEKKSKIEDDMKAQMTLIRNTEALAALQKSEKIEQDLHEIAAKYVAVCDDLRNVFKNNPSIKIDPNIKHVIDELPKDPFRFLASESESAKNAFDDAIAILEEEKPGNVKNLITRLSALSRDAEPQGRKVATMLPDQKALKRDIIKDVAALQVYDKQQFLMRAKFEEDALQTKIQFLIAELDPNKTLAMRSELKAIAKELGAAFEEDNKTIQDEKNKGNSNNDAKTETLEVYTTDKKE